MAGYGRGIYGVLADREYSEDEKGREKESIMRKNIALLLEYDGSRYEGWQRQGNTDHTIQGKLEQVLEKMTGAFKEVHGSGRTDAGVHALGQVANVHLDTSMSENEIQDYLNQYLPEDIRALEIKSVPERFHSRLWAREKLYTYWIDMDEKSSVFQRKYIYTLGQKLNIELMRQSAEYLCGTHDFSGFCTGGNKKKSTVRTLKSVEMVSHESQLEIRMAGDGFLYNMVRIITGTLIETGQGRRKPESVVEILERGDRKLAGFTAPAKGLFLTSVVYDTPIFRKNR